MPFDEKLADRIRTIVRNKGGFTEKKMFGGLAFMLGNKMCCGVLENKLVARVGPQHYEASLRKPHVTTMDFTGRPMKGYVYVSLPGVRNDTALKAWIQQCIDFTSTLVEESSRSKRKTVSQIESAEKARITPLSKLINLGPVTLREFKEMGITTFGQQRNLDGKLYAESG